MKRYDHDKRHRNWTKVWLIMLILLIVGCTVAAVLVRENYNQNLKPVNGSQRTVLVTIPQGSTIREIGKQLQDQGLIKSSWAFERYIYSQNVRDKLQAGSYYLRPSLGVKEIVEILTQGKVATDLVTILPGKRIDEIKTAFVNKSGFSPEVVDSALVPDQYADHPALSDKPKQASLEGYLYPETFQKTADTRPESIVRLSLDEMHKYLTPEIRAGITRQGLTVHQGVILASIIEREVGNVSDRPKVAQVFLKRLRADMPLESDATASYGAILAGAEPSITYDSPYNTYKHKGLPPGPISNSSRTSIEAVANPASTDFLYFVSGDDDSEGNSVTYFSRTLQEHEANVEAHCRKKCGL